MSITYEQATDEIFSIVKLALDAGGTFIGYAIDTRWPGVPRPDKPDNTKLWSRVSAKNVTEGQKSLSGATAKQMYEAVGLLYVQLFAPRNIGGSMESGRHIAEIVRSSFVGHAPSGEVWFRNQTIRELPEADDAYPFNVVVTFQYQTLR